MFHHEFSDKIIHGFHFCIYLIWGIHSEKFYFPEHHFVFLIYRLHYLSTAANVRVVLLCQVIILAA